MNESKGTEHDARHEDLLAELAAEERADEAFERSDLARCAACREAWRELGELAGKLDSFASAARAAAQSGSSPDSLAAEAAGERFVRARLAAASEPRRPRRALAFAALALAASIALFFSLRAALRDAPGRGPDTPLGGGELQLLAPAGEVDAWGTFRWSGELPANGWFVVRIFDPEVPGPEPLLASERLRDREWTPEIRQLATLRKLRWEVQVFDATNARVQLRSQSASLRD